MAFYPKIPTTQAELDKLKKQRGASNRMFAPVVISGGGGQRNDPILWGDIRGTLSEQHDLSKALTELAEAIDDDTGALAEALDGEISAREAEDGVINGRLDAQGTALTNEVSARIAADAAKANIFVRQAQGITVGNNIQGMHVRISEPVAYTSDWSFLTADGQSFVRTDNDLRYSDGDTEMYIVADGKVLVDDFTIVTPFLISAVTGDYSNPEFFWRYFDVKDIDQRIGLVSALETEDKSSVVNSINSLHDYVDAIVKSAEVADSPFDSYADFLAGSGGGIQQGKYAYVTFTDTDTWPSGGKWDAITAGDTWRLDCGVSAWSPTSNMTAATTATIADQSGTNALKAAGNDTVTSWLQSFRNNIKRVLGLLKMDGDGTKALLDNGTYGATGKVNKVNGIGPDESIVDPLDPGFRNVQTDYVYSSAADFEAAKASIPVGARVVRLDEYPDNVVKVAMLPDYNKRQRLTTMTDTGASWTATGTGFVWLRISNQVIDNARFNINGVDALNVVGTNDWEGEQILCPIAKGDVLTITGRAAHDVHDGQFVYYAAYFFPARFVEV
jgi:hypothetical protein